MLEDNDWGHCQDISLKSNKLHSMLTIFMYISMLTSGWWTLNEGGFSGNKLLRKSITNILIQLNILFLFKRKICRKNGFYETKKQLKAFL